MRNEDLPQANSSDEDEQRAKISQQKAKNDQLFVVVRKKGTTTEKIIAEIKELLDSGAEINAKNPKDKTILDIAVEKDNQELVKFLLQQPGINTNIIKTAKDLAQDSNNQDIAKSSLKRKTEDNIYNTGAKKAKVSTQEDGLTAKAQGNSQKRQSTSTTGDDVTPNKIPLLDNVVMPSEGTKLAEHGNIFQLKLLMLCLWRAAHNHPRYKGFRLATEMPEAEKFDDIAFQYKEDNNNKWKFRLIQAKHKEGATPSASLTKIKLGDLLSIDDDEAFSLQKFFHSYLKVRERSVEDSIYSVFSDSEIEDVIIITNTDFDSDKEKNIFVKDTQDIKVDALLKTDDPNTLVYKLRNENNVVINKLKIVFENSANFYKLTELLAQHIFSNKQIDKTNIFKEYNYPLVNEILKIDVKGTGKKKEYFINMDNFIEKKSVNGEALSKEAISIRSALIKEMAFRKGTVKIPEIDESFGNWELPNDEKELNELARKVAEFIKQNKKFTVNDFEQYHVALAQQVLNLETRQLRTKLINETDNPRDNKPPTTLSKFKKYFMVALNEQAVTKTITKQYLKNINIDNISEDFGRSELSSDEITIKTLAKKLAESVKHNKKLSVKDFQDNHVGLAAEVIDTNTGKFHKIFINGQEERGGKVKGLTNAAKKLRRLLLDEIESQDIQITINDREITIKELDAPLLRNLLSNQIKVSERFALVFKPEPNPEIKDINVFAEQMKNLINNVIQDKEQREQRVIKINDDSIKTAIGTTQSEKAIKTFNDNIKKLAGYVFINRFDKVRFSTIFLKSSKLPVNIDKLRDELKKILGNDQFELLCEYELKFDKPFKTCEDGELYRKLPVVHSDDDVKEFFSKLKFIVNYPNREKINDLLGPEIKDQFKTLDSKIFQSSYYENLHNWMADRVGTFYTPERTKQLFEQIQNHLSLWTIDGFNKPYFVDASQEYKFEKYDFLDDFLLGDKQILQLSCKDLFLGHTRIVQTFQEFQAADDVKIQQYTRGFGHIFLYLKQLNDMDFSSMVYEVLKKETYKFNLVVIECDTQQPEIEKELYNNLNEVIKSSSNKKVIFITTRADHALEANFKNSDQYKSHVDSSNFRDLIGESQQKLLEQEIVLQGQKVRLNGQKVSLNKLIDASDKKTKEIHNIIDVETLVKLMQGEEIRIGSKVKDLGEVSDYYIDRRLSRQVTLSKEKIKEDLQKSSSNSDLFVISGTDSGFKGNNYNVYVFDNTALAEDKFKELCKQNTRTNIHWLESDSEKLTWYKSQGSISSLIGYKIKVTKTVDTTDNTISTALEDILKDNHKMDIISGTAGMGKSIVLTNLLMDQWNGKDPSLWVIRIDLNDHTTALNNRKSSKFEEVVEVVNFLLNDLNVLASQKQESFQNKLFENIFNSNGKIALLFDGFDEISPDYKDIVISLLKSLKKSKVEKIFVTTRPNMCESLEKELGIFSYVLNPLSPEEQTEFLTRFWTKKLELENADLKYKERLKTYAQSIIEQISKSIHDKKQSLIAIPLQTKMIGEVFQEDQPLIKSKWQSCKKFLESENDKPKLPKDFALLDLYEHFIEKKFYQFHLEEKKGRDFTKVGEKKDADESYKIFKNNYAMLALHTLFSKEKLKKLLTTEEIKKLESIIENIKSGESNEGIAQIIYDKIHFIHRTFAEYFVSFLIAKKMLTTRSETLYCIENMVLNTSPIFINNIIEQLNGKIESSNPLLKFVIAPNDLTTDLKYSNFIKSLILFGNNGWSKKLDASGKTPLHYAIESNNFNIAKKLLNYANDIGTLNILKHGSFVEPEYEHSKLVEFINIQDKSGETALLYTMRKENLDFAFDLLLQGASIELLTDADVKKLINKMIHGYDYDIYKRPILGVYANQDNKYRPIQEKLLLKAPDEFSKLNAYQQSRILSYFSVHGRVECIKALVGTIDDAEQRKTILKNCDNNCTPLDRVNESRKLSDDERLEITKYLLENGGDKTKHYSPFRFENNYITKILQAAARDGHIKTFEYFIGQEVYHRYNIHLFEAIEYNQHNIIKYLYTSHKESLIDNDGNTALHAACDSGGPLKIIKFLIDNGELINAKNDKGETPLFMSLYSRSGLHVIEYLVTKGADFNHEDNSHNTPLSFAIESNQVDIIKYLVGKGASISEHASQFIKDQYEFWKNPNQYDLNLVQDGSRGPRVMDTPLHLAAQKGNYGVVSVLLEKGAIFNSKNMKGNTPGELAKMNQHKKIFELLELTEKLFIAIKENNKLEVKNCIDKGAYVNAKNQYGKTPLHLAAASDQNHDVVALLLENDNVDIESVDLNNNTPLHVAAEKDAIENVKLLLTRAIYNTKNRRDQTPLNLALKHAQSHNLLAQIDTLFQNLQSDNPQVNIDAVENIHRNYNIDISTIINTRDNTANTLLHYAAKLCEFDIVKVLLENGAIFNAKNKLEKTPKDLTNNSSITTLLEEIDKMFEDVDKVPQVLKKDSIKIITNVLDNEGKGLLHHAARYCKLELVKWLVAKGADVNHEDKLHKTPLSFAIESNQVDIIKYLVGKDASISEDASQLIKDQYEFWKNPNQYDLNLVQDGSPRLHTAIKSKNFEFAKFLVRQGADVNKVDTQGKTPLHWSAELQQVEMVEFLLQYGVLFDKTDNNNCTPRNLLHTSGRDNKIIWLLDVLNKLFSSQNLAEDLKKQGLKRCTFINELIDFGPYGCYYEYNNDANNPMLFILNARNSQEQTLLHIAASTGDAEAINILLEWNHHYLQNKKESNKFPRYEDYQSTSIDTKDSEGNTPLHLAAEKGNYEVVSLLLQKRAIFNSTNMKSNTPGELAKMNQHKKIFELLELTENLFIAIERKNKLEVKNCIKKFCCAYKSKKI